MNPPFRLIFISYNPVSGYDVNGSGAKKGLSLLVISL